MKKYLTPGAVSATEGTSRVEKGSYTLRLLFRITVTCLLTVLLVGCDVVQTMSDKPSEEKAPFRPDTTYDRSSVNHVWFLEHAGGVISSRWGFVYTHRGAIGVLARTHKAWALHDELAYNDGWFPAQPDPDAEHRFFDEPMDADGDRVLISAQYRYTYDSPHFDFWDAMATGIIFQWKGTRWEEEANLFIDDPLAVNVAIRYVSLEGNVAVVGVSGPGSEGTEALLFERKGTTWEKVALEGVSNALRGQVTGNQVLLWDDLDNLQVVRKSRDAWKPAYQAATPASSIYAAGRYTLFFNSGDVHDNSVYVLEREGDVWTEKPPLTPAVDTLATFNFGAVLATNDDFLAVTAQSSSSLFCSIVYLYERVQDRWIEVDVIIPEEDEFENAYGCSDFGESLSIGNGSLLIGGGGAVHLYTWTDDAEP